jgi:hypothetical protein
VNRSSGPRLRVVSTGCIFPAASGRYVPLKYRKVLVPSGLSKTVDRAVRVLASSREPATTPATDFPETPGAAAVIGATLFDAAAAFGVGGAGRLISGPTASMPLGTTGGFFGVASPFARVAAAVAR